MGADKVFKIKGSRTIAKITIMGNDAGSKDKYGRLTTHMKSPNSGLTVKNCRSVLISFH